MPTNHTTNYNLNQWVKSDQVRMEDFNADNAKLDAALTGLSSGKADKTALSSLQTTVNGKASTSALNALQSTLNSKISGLQSTVTSQGTDLGLRNCQVYTGSYQGGGQVGSGAPSKLTFAHKPVFLSIAGSDQSTFTTIRGQTRAIARVNGGDAYQKIAWSDRSVQWYLDQSGGYKGDHQMNGSLYTYQVFAILEIE